MSRDKKDRSCEHCSKLFNGRTLFCSNECVLAHTERYHAEYRAISLREKTLKKTEEVYMHALSLEERNIPYLGATSTPVENPLDCE